MTHTIFNILISFFFILYSVHTIYYTYKNPSDWWSTNFKGYISGFIFIVISVFSLVGKFNLFVIFSQLIRKTLRFKKDESAIGIVIFLLIVCVAFGLTYYRPDKIQARYYKIPESNKPARFKVLSSSLLFYYIMLTMSAYLITWLFTK